MMTLRKLGSSNYNINWVDPHFSQASELHTGTWKKFGLVSGWRNCSFWLRILTGSQIFRCWINKIIENVNTHPTPRSREFCISQLISNSKTWQPSSPLYFQTSKDSHDHSSNKRSGGVSDMWKKNAWRQNSLNTCHSAEWRAVPSH